MSKENGSTWKIDLDAWGTMGDVEDWQETCLSGRTKHINQLMATVVRAWPYAGDPANINAYRALSATEWAEAVRQVGEAVGTIFRPT